MKLYRLTVGVRRSADLEEVRAVTDEEWAQIQAHNGVTLYFGEIAGKHSEVSFPLPCAQIKILSEDPAEVALFEKWFPGGHIGALDVLGAIEGRHEGRDDCPCGYKDSDDEEDAA